MTTLQDEIINELYFVTSYQEAFLHLKMDENLFRENLSSLLKLGYIAQYEQGEEFAKRTTIDFNHLEKFYYLATKKGLLEHTGMM